MNLDNKLWSELFDLNRKADALIERAMKRVRPTSAISREIVNVSSVEVQWNNLPASYDPGVVLPTNSDARHGNSVKRGIYTNHGSRIYIREMGHDIFGRNANNSRISLTNNTNNFSAPVPYFKWNFSTSITQRQYADKMISSRALGRPETGSHLVFREPFILEPMETLIVEADLRSYGNFNSVESSAMPASLVINFNFFGYREGM